MWRERGLRTEVGRTLIEWDNDLVLYEKVGQNQNVIETKWNQGKNAKQTQKIMKIYGEYGALKFNS